jgi:hypothetical protein
LVRRFARSAFNMRPLDILGFALIILGLAVIGGGVIFRLATNRKVSADEDKPRVQNKETGQSV